MVMSRAFRRLALALPAVAFFLFPNGSAAGPQDRVRTETLVIDPGFQMEILVDGRRACEYTVRRTGVRYIEAIKGKTYEIRLHNPLGVRVAVALSVDGLNTIDARHTTAREARKWVLGPHETITISGWQVNRQQARRFFFTTEERSYAERLGRPDDIGIISAVFFRERGARVIPLGINESAGDAGERRGRSEAPLPAPPGAAKQAGGAVSARPDDLAATGIGERTEHAVQLVHLDLEEEPAATLDLRYEYRPQLARLGLLGPDREDPLARREKAKGFTPGFCPDIK